MPCDDRRARHNDVQRADGCCSVLCVPCEDRRASHNDVQRALVCLCVRALVCAREVVPPNKLLSPHSPPPPPPRLSPRGDKDEQCLVQTARLGRAVAAGDSGRTTGDGRDAELLSPPLPPLLPLPLPLPLPLLRPVFMAVQRSLTGRFWTSFYTFFTFVKVL